MASVPTNLKVKENLGAHLLLHMMGRGKIALSWDNKEESEGL
jgi:hypothetical protein